MIKARQIVINIPSKKRTKGFPVSNVFQEWHTTLGFPDRQEPWSSVIVILKREQIDPVCCRSLGRSIQSPDESNRPEPTIDLFNHNTRTRSEITTTFNTIKPPEIPKKMLDGCIPCHPLTQICKQLNVLVLNNQSYSENLHWTRRLERIRNCKTSAIKLKFCSELAPSELRAQRTGHSTWMGRLSNETDEENAGTCKILLSEFVEVEWSVRSFRWDHTVVQCTRCRVAFPHWWRGRPVIEQVLSTRLQQQEDGEAQILGFGGDFMMFCLTLYTCLPSFFERRFWPSIRRFYRKLQACAKCRKSSVCEPQDYCMIKYVIQYPSRICSVQQDKFCHPVMET